MTEPACVENRMSSAEQTSDDQGHEQPWTLGKLLTWTTDFLKERGSDSAQLDAQLLLAHARGCERIDLYTAYDEVASDELRTTFRDLVRHGSQHSTLSTMGECRYGNRLRQALVRSRSQPAARRSAIQR